MQAESKAEQTKAIFGQKICDVMKKEREKSPLALIPSFLKESIDEILVRGLKNENLFSQANSPAKLDSLKSVIDKGEKYDLSKESPVLLSRLIKAYLKSLPEPLIPVKHYKDFASALSNHGQIFFIFLDLIQKIKKISHKEKWTAKGNQGAL